MRYDQFVTNWIITVFAIGLTVLCGYGLAALFGLVS